MCSAYCRTPSRGSLLLVTASSTPPRARSGRRLPKTKQGREQRRARHRHAFDRSLGSCVHSDLAIARCHTSEPTASNATMTAKTVLATSGSAVVDTMPTPMIGSELLKNRPGSTGTPPPLGGLQAPARSQPGGCGPDHLWKCDLGRFRNPRSGGGDLRAAHAISTPWDEPQRDSRGNEHHGRDTGPVRVAAPCPASTLGYTPFGRQLPIGQPHTWSTSGGTVTGQGVFGPVLPAA